MKLKLYSFRYGLEIIQNLEDTNIKFEEFLTALKGITDDDIIALFNKRKREGKNDKGLSIVINQLIKERLTKLGWVSESPIFKDTVYNSGSTAWRLDFVAPELFSVEVAFNNQGSIAINLLKPVLASELNHVEKAFQTEFGLIVTATNEMRDAGGFDATIGTFEKYISQTKPLRNQLTTPLVILGIEAPETFKVLHNQVGNRKIGKIVNLNTGEIIE
ncbi:hypothetical protein FACS1894193_02110 [Bacilli bacterium]|nr:hypothetical protein FACS1894193_02110 [Bacilli bacterium]